MVTPKKANPKPRGSKPGERRGGRKKGTPNKKNSYQQAVSKLKTKQVKEGEEACRTDYGTTPLEFMLNVMRDEKLPMGFRYAAAKDSAPYQHAKLASVILKGDPTAPLQQVNMNKEEFENIAKQVAKDI